MQTFWYSKHVLGENISKFHEQWYLYYVFFSVPVHKVDDITHVNFTDRDHLWFDPNWKNSNGGGVGTGHASNASGGTNNNAG